MMKAELTPEDIAFFEGAKILLNDLTADCVKQEERLKRAQADLEAFRARRKTLEQALEVFREFRLKE
jgi:hypothetical protein